MYIISKKLPRFKVPLGWNILVGRADSRLFAATLRSIDPISDQIVVLMDEKAPLALYGIARQYTDDIFYHRWDHDFAKSRNRILSKTHTHYVAWIDTDEFLEFPHMARISNLMTKPLGLAYYVNQISPTTGNMTLIVPQIRIFPNVPGVKWEIPIHEQILPSLRRAGVRTQLTDLRIAHLGYMNPDTVYRKHRRNLVLLRRAVRSNPVDRFTLANYHKALAYERWWRSRKGATA